MIRSAPTIDIIEAELARCFLPSLEEGARRSWLDLVRDVATHEGVDHRAVYARSRYHSVVRARHRTWRLLRIAGYSFPEIARPFGVDPTTVMAAVGKLPRGMEAA